MKESCRNKHSKTLCLAPYKGGKVLNCDSYLNEMTAIKHQTYLEVFGGMGTVCINKPRCENTVINDKNIANAILLKAISADYAVASAFFSELKGASYCEECFTTSYKILSEADIENRKLSEFEGKELARVGAALFNVFNMSYMGQINGIFYSPKNTYEKYKAFKNRLNMLPEIFKRMNGVTVKNNDAVELIEKYKNNRNVLIFADPPYLPDNSSEKNAERSKNSETSYRESVDWNRLIDVMLASKSKIILCGYNSDKLQKLLNFNWRIKVIRYDQAVQTPTKTNEQHKSRSDELIYTNF